MDLRDASASKNHPIVNSPFQITENLRLFFSWIDQFWITMFWWWYCYPSDDDSDSYDDDVGDSDDDDDDSDDSDDDDAPSLPVASPPSVGPSWPALNRLSALYLQQ